MCVLQYVDGVRFRMSAPFDFGFLAKYGRVFCAFDDQDSGNICFGVEKGGERYFVKFAGAPTMRATVPAAEAVANLRAAADAYYALRHENLIELVCAESIGGGYALVFRWVDAICMGRAYSEQHRRFFLLSVDHRLRVFGDIQRFMENVAQKGYVAVDFYDGSVMYDEATQRTVICDIDFFEKQPYINQMGRMWGSSRFMSPEEFELGAAVDEVTNIYTLGAMAFALFGGYERTREAWQLSDALFAVAAKAVSDDRGKRQRSIRQFMEEWDAAL